jgi:hypothetical protein
MHWAAITFQPSSGLCTSAKMLSVARTFPPISRALATRIRSKPSDHHDGTHNGDGFSVNWSSPKIGRGCRTRGPLNIETGASTSNSAEEPNNRITSRKWKVVTGWLWLSRALMTPVYQISGARVNRLKLPGYERQAARGTLVGALPPPRGGERN